MQGSQSSQTALMHGLAAGDSAAFSALYDQLAVHTYAICLHYLRTRAAADDAMMGLWISIWQNAQLLALKDGSPFAILTAVAEAHAQSQVSRSFTDEASA